METLTSLAFIIGGYAVLLLGALVTVATCVFVAYLLTFFVWKALLRNIYGNVRDSALFLIGMRQRHKFEWIELSESTEKELAEKMRDQMSRFVRQTLLSRMWRFIDSWG